MTRDEIRGPRLDRNLFQVFSTQIDVSLDSYPGHLREIKGSLYILYDYCH
jgi:hypothetical protein